MRLSHRLLLSVALGGCLLGGFRPGEPKAARAFKIPVHEAILEKALGDQMSAEARSWVQGHYYVFTSSGGGAASDTVSGQFFDFLHFDSARNPAEICERWRAGV